jgi:hypothetical protein
MDAPTQQRLQDIVGRERLSELMYVGQAFPWAPWHDSTAREEVMHLVTARRHTLIELGKWMGRHHIPIDTTESYPSRFMTINFLSLEHLLPRLLADERAGIAALEADLAHTKDRDARGLMEGLLLQKREHAARLEHLAEPHASPAGT